MQIILPLYNNSNNEDYAKEFVKVINMIISEFKFNIHFEYLELYENEFDGFNLIVNANFELLDFIPKLRNYYKQEDNINIFEEYFNNNGEFHSKNFANIMKLVLEEKNINSQRLSALIGYILYSKGVTLDLINEMIDFNTNK